MTHQEKVDMLIKLSDALREVTYYINQYPPRFDLPFWLDTHTRLTDRMADLEEYIFIDNLDIPSYYNMEEVRQQTIHFIKQQGVFRHDDIIYDKN